MRQYAENPLVLRETARDNGAVPALPIIIGEREAILRATTVRVPKVTKEIVKLAKDLLDTMVKAEGAGIAAPQVGRTERMCIAMINKKPVTMINPEITWKSDETVLAEEGCLSLPEIWVEVPRAQAIRVRYTDSKGKQTELALRDWDARVVQHETDHLDGVLIVDYAK